MADTVSDVNIEKGVHLSVVVEFCVQNIIVVCFKNKGKEYKGVLLESSGGILPFTLPFIKPFPSASSLQNTVAQTGVSLVAKRDPSSINQNVPKSENHEVPATTQRYSYNCDPFLVSPQPATELTVVEMKPIAPRAKTIRDIRLRPRQTLCSNCKCAIHEGRKTRSVSHTVSHEPKNTTSIPDSRLRPRVNGTSHISPLHSRPPKRKNDTQSPLVLLEDIKKSTRLSGARSLRNSVGATENEPSHTEKLSNFQSSVESLTNTTNRLRASRRSLLSETNINHASNIQSDDVSKDDVSSNNSLSKTGRRNRALKNDSISKPSPTIKISIGAGAILKIPPRLPDSETCLANSASEADNVHSDSAKDAQIHRKTKKSTRKTRDKDKHKIIENDNGDSLLLNGEQSINRSLKKHKKKHRHRHPSPEPNSDLNTSCRESMESTDDYASVDNGIENSVTALSSAMEPSQSSMLAFDAMRKAISPPPQKKIKVGDCFIDVVDISESESDNDTQNAESSMKNENHLNASLGSEDLSNSRPRLLYTWSQDQGLSRVVSTSQTMTQPQSVVLSNPQPVPQAAMLSNPYPVPQSTVVSNTQTIPQSRIVPNPQTVPQTADQSPRYLVKSSPNILPIANSPHRRKNASPGRVINTSPNIHFANSPSIKDYPLRSRTGSLSNQPTDLLTLAEHSMVPVSEDSQSHSSGLDSHLSEISGESGEEEHHLENIFPRSESISQEEDEKDLSKPLMLKIQTQTVTECVLDEGREIHVGDIVWGKIQGFPWWPGRVSSITVTQRDNNVIINQLANVAWFGSNTMSHVHCCDLFPFLEDFKVRYNKKKKGPYKIAIKQATMAAQKMANGMSPVDILEFSD